MTSFLWPGVFFISRHPLKIVWAIVVLTIAICFAPLSRTRNFDLKSTSSREEGSGALYRAQPFLLASDLDEGVVIERIAGNNDQYDVLGSRLHRLGGRLQRAHHEFLQRHVVVVAAGQDVVVIEDPKLIVEPLGSKKALNEVLVLVQRKKWLEIAFLLTGLLGALYAVFILFQKFRHLGSKFSLACCTLLMTAMDLLVGLYLMDRMGLTVDPLLLMEFGPVFLMAVGFRKAYVLARNVYRHRRQKGDVMSMVAGVEESAGFLAWSYGKELALFTLFSLSGVWGLREFGLLCVMMLLVDMVLLHTFFLGIIAYRLRLHAFRTESTYHSLEPFEESRWKSYGKLLATLVVLGLYASNVFCSLSAQVGGPSLDERQLRSLLADLLPAHARIVVERTLLLCKDDNLDDIGIGSIVREIMRLTIFDDSHERLNLERLLKVCIFISLPISLTINYYLFQLLKRATRTISSQAGLLGAKRNARPRARSQDIPADDRLVLERVRQGKIPLYTLEKYFDGDCMRAVRVRRQYVEEQLQRLKADAAYSLDGLPWREYDYGRIRGRNCENVLGYATLPVGVAGPILVDDREYFVPMATTEGALVASTSRGCKAVSYAGGVRTALTGDGMTRGPVVALPSLAEAVRLIEWIRSNFEYLSQVFNATSPFLSLDKIDCRPVGRLVYLRFKARTGDAMGMNMVSRATDSSLQLLLHAFPAIKVISLSGNFCSDKKAATINWLDGRGKSVVVEAVIPQDILRNVLKTTAVAMAEASTAKNLVGSMVAGSVGGSGCNAHAANIVAAMFIALGQDPGQIVSSSSCLTFMETANDGADLYVSCTMPSIECGTVGGGTGLASQRACLEMLVSGPIAEATRPGEEAARLARIIAATVMAGELSLLASLTEGTLVKAHQVLNAK